MALSGVGVEAQTAPQAGSGGVDAGFGRGVTIRSADGSASLNIRARLQLRSTISDDPDDDRSAFTEIAVRRMRLVFQGNARGPKLTYYVQLGLSNQDTEADLRLPLRDFYVTWALGRGVSLRAGQMKVPFSRQRVVSSSALQFADRAAVVSELNLDRDIGVQVFSRRLFGLEDRLGYAVSIFGGEGRNRLGRDAGYLYTARVEAWPFGAFDDYVEADIARDPKPRLAIGAGYGYNQNTNRPRSTTGEPYAGGDFDYRHAEADFVFKQRGLAVTGEVMYRSADVDRRTVVVNGVSQSIASRSGWGAYIQGGQMVTPHLELGGRYGHLAPREGTASSFVASDELSVGASYYELAHNLKLQGDYSALIARGTPGRTHQVRLQLQFFF